MQWYLSYANNFIYMLHFIFILAVCGAVFPVKCTGGVQKLCWGHCCMFSNSGDALQGTIPGPRGATTPGLILDWALKGGYSFPGLGLQGLSVWGLLGMLGQEDMVSLPAGGGCWQWISSAKWRRRSTHYAASEMMKKRLTETSPRPFSLSSSTIPE